MIRVLPSWFRSRPKFEEQAGYDVWLLVITLVLCISGAIFVLTSSAARSWSQFHGNSMAIFQSHVGRLVWGLVCMTALAFTDYHILQKAARFLWYLSVAALIAVLFVRQPEEVTAHRWLYLFGFSFQPAELAKYALINYLAVRFGSYRDDPVAPDLKKLHIGALTFTVITFVMMLIEPNLSMAILVLATASVLFFLSGIRVKRLLVIGSACFAPLGAIAWLVPYMHDRLAAYWSGVIHPLQAGYHVKQSLVGIGQGGFFGLGLGGSTQKFFFLPKPYKDFIFSVVGEELGFLGAVMLLLGFLFLLYRGWKISQEARDHYGYYLAAGITVTIALSFFVNIGVTLGLLPATGQPLPLISYGGSSMMMTLGAVGILLSISRHSRRESSSQMQSLDWQ